MAVLGGRAHLNGVTFATSTHVVRGKLKHGVVTICAHKLPESRLLELMDRVPFMRGVSKIVKLNWKLLFLLVLLLLIPWDWFFPANLPDTLIPLWLLPVIYALVLLILLFMLKELWQFHGAEHKAFNVYVNGGQLLLDSVKAADRVSERCGTNLVVILLPLFILLTYVFYQIPLLVYVVSLSISYEIFNWSSRHKRLKAVFKIAAFIQRYLVTKEPSEEQIQVAISTLSKAIELDQKGAVRLT